MAIQLGIVITKSYFLTIDQLWSIGNGGTSYQIANGMARDISLVAGSTNTFQVTSSPILGGSSFSWTIVSGTTPTGLTPTGLSQNLSWPAAGFAMIRVSGDDGSGPVSATINVSIVDQTLINKPGFSLLFDRVEGWESMPTYNSLYASGNTVDTSTFTSWSAPLSSSNVLDYFRRKQTAASIFFPDYVGTPGLIPDYMDALSESYGYPSWRRFALDKNRPGTGSTIINSDQTDFGWWMNTDNLGKSTNAAPPVTYKGTTALGLYQGLDGFFSHAGHSNVTLGLFKLTNSLLGTKPSEYVTGAENNMGDWIQMISNLVFSDKPCIVLLSANPVRTPALGNMVIQNSNTDNSPSTGKRTQVFQITYAYPGATYTLEVYSHSITYTAVLGDTTTTIATALKNMLNATTETQWNSVGSAPAHGTNGFPPTATSSGNLVTIILNIGNNFAGFSVVTGLIHSDDIPSSALADTVGGEHVSDIHAYQIFTPAAGGFTQNDDPTQQLTPITGAIGSDLDHVTGNAYTVIGLGLPSSNVNLPANTHGKYLLICKNNAADRNDTIYFTIDTNLQGATNEDSFWNRLIATYVVSPTPTSYVPPRIPLSVDPVGGQSVCENSPIIVHAPIITGTPINHRFTNIDNGFGETYNLNNPGPITITNPVAHPQTFNTPGNVNVNYLLSDSVTHVNGTFTIVVNPDLDASFTVSDILNNVLNGPTNYTLANGYQYIFDPTIGSNPAYTYAWTIQRTDASGSPSNYTFVSGNSATKGPVTIQFNTPGAYDISLTLTSSLGCASVYVIHAIISVITLDFTSDPPPYVAQPIQFHGTCSTTVSAWSWDFGDGGTSTIQNPTYTFGSLGTKTITLYATTAYGVLSVTHTLTIIPASAVADFIYSPNVNIVTGETINFLDLSTPVNSALTPAWFWDFGDGHTSTLQNPAHAYSAPGTYSVALTYSITYLSSTVSSTVAKAIVVISGAPVVRSQTFIIGRNLSATYDVSQFAVGNGSLTFSITGQPLHGTAVMTDSTHIQYSPLPASTEINYIGLDRVKFRATDMSINKFAEGYLNLIIRPPDLQVTSGEILNTVHENTLRIRVGTEDVGELRKQTVIFTNIGTGPLFIELVSIIDDIAGVFSFFDFTGVSMGNPTDILIQPNEEYAFKIGMQAMVAGEFKAKLKIDHN